MKMDDNEFERLEEVPFTPIIREATLENFKIHCKDNYNDHLKLFILTSEIDAFLSSKVNEGDNVSKEYFTRFLNFRIRDHFSSSLVLISQGFIVDAISLTRSSLEDLLILFNFHITKKFFKQWYESDEDFKIKVGNLRGNVKNSPFFKHKEGEYFDIIYKQLSEILHPKKESLVIMASFHPTFASANEIPRLKKYSDLITLSFYIYEVQLCNFLEDLYPEDKEKIAPIKQRLENNIRIKSLIDSIG